MTSSDSDKNDKIIDQGPKAYVAVGASAGGVEALESMLRYMPVDTGVAFIIIQHLSPDFKSVMNELLTRYTTMPVHTANEGMLVEANSIYLIPQRKNMMIAEGKLILVDQMPERGLNFPIDIFFRSLAEDQHHRALAVVLSGTGSDGSRGIHAIKEVGGLVIVQEPRSAKFDGMPISAVRTGVADVVVEATEIPAKIVQYVTHPVMDDQAKAITKNVEDDEKAMEEILSLLNDKSDIDFSLYKNSTIVRRIDRRLGINCLTSYPEYLKLLQKNQKEIHTLAKDLLIGVTRFFRDAAAFDVLEKKVIPNILANTPESEPIRIWVAGCSTGEEAYSIAILFDEAMREAGQNRTIKIFATDADPEAIAEASAGSYSPNVTADISEERVHKYFSVDHDQITVTPNIRQMVVFATHNLIKDPPFSNTQLATCRNVLIYFQHAAQKRVLSMLHFSTRQHGYIFLGTSDSLGDLKKHFEPISEKQRIFKKISNVRNLDGTIPLFDTISKREHDTIPSVEQLSSSYQRHQSANQFGVVRDSLIEDYAPPTVVVDEEHNVLHVFGDVSPYTIKLRAGKFSANFRDIINESLKIVVFTALHRAANEESTVQYDNVQYSDESGDQKNLELRVRHIKNPIVASPYFAVIFKEKTPQSPNKKQKPLKLNIDQQTQQRIRDLENQLQKKHEHLQATVEELETTNEELQASNEELMAANEELQSTNEELQSVNEELYTVNSEYQGKIEELTQVNTDLDNIVKSTSIGIIFLDDAMLIRSFSEAACNIINLLPSDIGRPFHHISHELKYENFLSDIARVTKTGLAIEKEVTTDDNRVMHIKLMPYKDENDLNSGCVISISDITKTSVLEGKLAESHKELRATIATALYNKKQQIRVLVVDDDLDDCVIIKKSLFADDGMQSRFVVEEAYSYDDAMTLLRNNNYDVCLIDYDLGNHTALELIEGIHENSTTPAFIMLSGALDDKITLKAIGMGLYDTIDKNNISPQLLARSIRYALRDKQTVQYLTKHAETLS